MKIQRNIGGMDALLRTVISLFMIYFGFFSTMLITDHVAGMVLGIFGIMSLLVALIRYCPLYSVIGFSTADNKDNNKSEFST